MRNNLYLILSSVFLCIILSGCTTFTKKDLLKHDAKIYVEGYYDGYEAGEYFGVANYRLKQLLKELKESIND